MIDCQLAPGCNAFRILEHRCCRQLKLSKAIRVLDLDNNLIPLPNTEGVPGSAPQTLHGMRCRHDMVKKCFVLGCKPDCARFIGPLWIINTVHKLGSVVSC